MIILFFAYLRYIIKEVSEQRMLPRKKDGQLESVRPMCFWYEHRPRFLWLIFTSLFLGFFSRFFRFFGFFLLGFLGFKAFGQGFKLEIDVDRLRRLLQNGGISQIFFQ